MINTNGENIKYIDGVQKASFKSSNPIQVELPFDTPTDVKVTWHKTPKSTAKIVASDKFYSIASAALTGTKPAKEPRQRLRRSAKNNAITIADAIKSAQVNQELDFVNESYEFSSNVKDIASGFVNSFKKSIFDTYENIHEKYIARKELARNKQILESQSSRQKFVKARSSKFYVIQSVLLIVSLIALLLVTTSYIQYRSSVNAAMESRQTQSDAQWQELQARWQCINNKWMQMQSTTPANNETKGDSTC